MSIKLTLLKSGETLISEMKELVAEESQQAPAYLLENPHIRDRGYNPHRCCDYNS